MKTFKGILSLGLCAAMLVGCGGGGSSKSGDKIINIAALQDVASMDSTLATDGDSFTALRLANEGLYFVNQDNESEFGVAEKLEKSTDGTVYTFTLRKDAKWSNGDAVVAGDFVYSWRKLAGETSDYKGMLGAAGINCLNGDDVLEGKKPVDQLGIKAIDDKTLEITLATPCAYFESLMSFPAFYPINEKFATSKGDQYASKPENMLSNGPYKVTDWQQGSIMKLVKSDTYWAKDAIKLDGININVKKDANAAVLSFENGELDYCTITGELIGNYKDKPELFNKLTGYYWYVVPNIAKVPDFQNKNLRMALALSFDKDSLVNDVLKDGSKAATFLVPYKIASLDGKDFRDSGGKYLTTDVKKAKEYFEIAKKELGKTEFNYEFLIDDDEVAQKSAQYLKDQWEKNLPGLTVSLKPVIKKARTDAMKPEGGRSFELAFARWGPDYGDPTTYTNLFATKDSPFNYGEWDNQEYRDLVKKATIGEDGNNLEARWQDLIDAEKIIMDDAAIFPTYQLGGASLKNTKLKNLYYTPINNECFRYCELED